MLLKSAAVVAFKINFQGFLAFPKKTQLFLKIQKLSEIPHLKAKNIIVLQKA
jgi:hypothetical protein